MPEIVVLVTAASPDEASRIGRDLVEQRLAACANIVPGVTSIFSWQGKISEETECLLILKSRDELFDQIMKAVKASHSYELPEVIALPIVSGLPEYLRWICESTSSH